jgi:hypothetical protein
MLKGLDLAHKFAHVPANGRGKNLHGLDYSIRID